MTSPLRALSVAVGLGAVLYCPPAAACTASAGGAFSYELDTGPHAGILCSRMVRVHRGPSCAVGTFAWQVEMACHQTANLAVDEDGTLVSIIAPRSSDPDQPVVRIVSAFHPQHGAECVVDDLPWPGTLYGVGLLRFEGGDLVRIGPTGTPMRIPLAALPRPSG